MAKDIVCNAHFAFTGAEMQVIRRTGFYEGDREYEELERAPRDREYRQYVVWIKGRSIAQEKKEVRAQVMRAKVDAFIAMTVRRVFPAFLQLRMEAEKVGVSMREFGELMQKGIQGMWEGPEGELAAAITGEFT